MDFQSNEPFDMGETGLFEENHGFSFSPVPNTASHGSQNDAFVPANPATFKPTQSRDRAFYPDFGSQTSVKPANRQTQESRRSQPAREEMRTRAPALHNLKESLNCIRPLSGLESRVSTVETQ